MKHEETRRDEQDLVFAARDTATGYGVLAAALLLVGASMVWWWPGAHIELLTPWVRDQWGHLDALAYTMLVAIVGGLLVVFGGVLSDRGRRHEIRFELDRGVASVVEWWRGIEIAVEFGLERFCSFEVHPPVNDPEQVQLGAILDNGSYWRLDRGADDEGLHELADELRGGIDDDTDEISDPPIPERIDVERGDEGFVARWRNRERTTTRALFLVTSLLLAVAALLPVWLVFDGPRGGLAAGVVAAVATLLIPLSLPDVGRTAWPFAIFWFIVAVATVVGLDANWAYFPVGTILAAIFGRSALNIARGFGGGEHYSLEVTPEGTIRQNGEIVTESGSSIDVDDFEAAIVNVTEHRPPTFVLVEPGGAAHNRDGYLGDGHDHEDDEGKHEEPVELDMVGLSLFELVALSLLLDNECTARGDTT